MTEVFVIHGVKNHVRTTFEATVQRLQERVTGLELVPVFWGDLGAADKYLEHVIPSPGDREDVRDLSEPAPDKPDPEIVDALLGARDEQGDIGTRDGEMDAATRRRIIAERAGEGPDGLSPQEWQTALEETWPELPYLRSIGNPDTLRELGEGLARTPEDAPAPAGGETVRGNPIDWAKRRLLDMEAAASAVIGAAAGRVNEMLRTQIGPDLAQFAGDIAVYQRRQAEIHARVREVLAPYGAGTPEHPAHVVAHSLGGVIMLDMATSPTDPLHIGGLVTFGSQWPFFHLIDPREGVGRFDGATPVPMPDTIHGRWLNLWEPLDPLAFTAAHTLVLPKNPPDPGAPSNPDDRRARYRTESGLWTHSSYWTSQELLVAMQDAFPR